MSNQINTLLEPVSSGEITTLDMLRYDEVEARHKQVAELLEKFQSDALLITQPHNFAWFTAGGECRIGVGGEPAAALFISKDARLLICSNVDSGQLFDQEVSGLGFQLKERPWYKSRQGLLDDLSRGRKIIVDQSIVDQQDCSAELAMLRQQLSPYDQQRLELLGKDVVHAVEACLRSAHEEMSEQELSAQVSHRLLKRGITPIQIQVVSNGKSKRYRHWNPSLQKLQQEATVSIIGRRKGLHAGCARTMAFGENNSELNQNFHRLSLVCATAWHFMRAFQPFSLTWEKLLRIYEKFGIEYAWRQAELGYITGYAPVEHLITPDDPVIIKPGMAVFWNPAVNSVIAGDTLLIKDHQYQVITPIEHWPVLTVEVRGRSVICPSVYLKKD